MLLEEPETDSSEKGEAKSKTPSEPKDKIKAIRTTLFHIAQEEEEEAVSLRVAYQIRQVKDQKEHPEKYPPPPPRVSPKPKKKTFGQKMLDLFPQRGDSGGEVVRKSIFLFSAAVFLVCVVLIVLYFVDIFRADKMYDDIGSAYHANFATQTTELTQPQPESEEPTEKIYTLLPGAADLLAMNSEINGWISIPGTKVDYPVLHHLDDEPGNEYYLYRNVQKEDSKPGSIFLDYRCSFDDVGEDAVRSAWSLSRMVKHIASIDELFETCDYITIHVPYMDSTKGMINKEAIDKMKDGVTLLNFARGELVDNKAVIEGLASGKVKHYVTDFPSAEIAGVDKVITIPHLGASTEESEENCAEMAVDQLMNYLENGNIVNSVNYPNCDLGEASGAARITVHHKNLPNMIGQLTAILAADGHNISNMLNKSKGEWAYSMFDMEKKAPTEETIKKMEQIDGVVRVRVL